MNLKNITTKWLGSLCILGAALTASGAMAAATPTDMYMYSDGPTNLTIQWQSGGVDTAGYYIAFAGGSSPAVCTNGIKIVNPYYVRNDLAPNRTYTVTVCAYDNQGRVSRPVSATETTQESSAYVPAPRNLYVSSDSQTQLTLQWQSGGGSTVGFYVAFATGTTAPACTGGSRVTNPYLVRSNLSPGSTYTVTVCAYDSQGNASQGISATQTTQGSDRYVPAPRNLFVSSDSQTQLTLQWQSGGGRTAGFFVSFAGGVSPGLCTGGIRVTNLYLVRSDLSPNSTYTVSVCAYDAQGNVSQQISATQTTQGSTRYVAPPRNISILVNGRSFSINWESGGGSTAGFYVAFAGGSNAGPCTGGIKVANPQHVRNDLSPNATYTVSVCAYDRQGNVSQQISATQTTASLDGGFGSINF